MADVIGKARKFYEDDKKFYAAYHGNFGEFNDLGAYLTLGGQAMPKMPTPLEVSPELLVAGADNFSPRLWLPVFSTAESFDEWNASARRVQASFRDIVRWPMREAGVIDGLVIDPFGENLQIPTQLLSQVASKDPKGWRGSVLALAEFDPIMSAMPSGLLQPMPSPRDGEDFALRLTRDKAMSGKKERRGHLYEHIRERIEEGGTVLVEYECRRDEKVLEECVVQTLTGEEGATMDALFRPVTIRPSGRWSDDAEDNAHWIAVYTHPAARAKSAHKGRVFEISLDDVSEFILDENSWEFRVAGLVIDPRQPSEVAIPFEDLLDLLDEIDEDMGLYDD